MTSPWCVYGQTPIETASLAQNPTPNTTGALGEVTSLPYIVPEGKILTIKRSGIEAHWGGSIVFWIGDEFSTDKCLCTVGGSNGYGDGSVQAYGSRAALTGTWWAEMGFSFASGTKINLYVNSTYQPPPGGNIFGWWASGELRDA